MSETQTDVASLKQALKDKTDARLQELGGKIQDLLKQYNATLVPRPVINDQGLITATVQLASLE